eukprot:scaffold84377_cov75-Phaeocystis_antarctica.AAC.5
MPRALPVVVSVQASVQPNVPAALPASVTPNTRSPLVPRVTRASGPAPQQSRGEPLLAGEAR